MAWYDLNLKYRLEIELTNTYNTNDLTDYMALVSFNDIPAEWRTHFFSNVQGRYQDVVFTTSDGITQVPHVLDLNAGSDYAWLKVPTLNAGTTTHVYLYYGCSFAQETSDPSTVYSDYRAIYHLGDSSTTIYDATINSNDGTLNGSIDVESFVVGRGQVFNGTDNYITVPHDSTLDITDDIWIQFWIETDTTGSIQDIVQKGNSFRIYAETGGKINFVTGANTLTTAGSLSANTTKKVTCIRKNGVKYIYFDGVLDSSVTYTTALSTNTDPLLISSATNPLDGTLDELQIGTFAPTYESQHIETEYQNEFDNTAFSTYTTFEVSPLTGSGGITIEETSAAHVIGDTYYPAIEVGPTYTGGSAEYIFQREYTWTYRIAITTNSANIPDGADLIDYPMLFDMDLPDDVQAHIGNEAYGDEFVFTDSDEETQIPHEIENYDPTTGRLKAWVKIPVLPTTTDKTIWLYYRHNNIPSTQDLASTWSDYFAVYHLHTDPLGDAPQAKDSTQNGYDMESRGFVASDFQTGIVDKGYYFDDVEAGNKLTSQLISTFGDWQEITSEAWINKLVEVKNDEMVFGQQATDKENEGGAHYLGAKDDKIRVQLRTDSNDERWDIDNQMIVDWNYIAFNWSAVDDAVGIFHNGARASTQTLAGTYLYNDTTVPMTIGNTYQDDSRPAKGIIDEVRVSRERRPDHYYGTVYNNLTSPTTFVSVSQPEAHYRGTGGIKVSYISSALNDRTIIFAYPGPVDTVHGPSGGVITSGTATREFTQNYTPTGAITINGIAYTIQSKNYIGSGSVVTNGTAYTFQDYWYYGSGGVTTSYISDPLNDRTIVFPYTPSGGINVTYISDPLNDRDIILSYVASGGVNVSYTSDPLNDRDIVFSYIASGTAFTLGGTAVNFIERIIETSVTTIQVSYISDPLNDRTIELYYTSSGGITTNGTVPNPEEINRIVEVDIKKALSLGGGEYYITFERTMSGAIFIAGTVPEFDEVATLPEVIITPITLSGFLDDNVVDIKFREQPVGQIKFTFPVLAGTNVEFVWDAYGLIRLSGENTATIEPNALFLYEGSGVISVADTAVYSYSTIKGYIPTGGIKVQQVVLPHTEYSYIPIFEYISSGVTLTLLGGIHFVTKNAVTPSGGILLNAPGDITADEIAWKYSYTSSDYITITPIFTTTKLEYERTSKVTAVITSGTVVDSITKNYEYTGTGLIEVVQASIHRYEGTGRINIGGSSEYTRSEIFEYTSTGAIKTARSISSYYVTIAPRVYTRPISISGSFATTIEFYYTTSGTIRLLDPSQSIIYTSPYRLKIKLSGDAISYISDYHYLASGYVTVKGTAHYILQEPNTYKSSGKIYTRPSSTSEVSYIFEYEGLGTISSYGVATTSSKTIDTVYRYQGSGSVATAGTAGYTYSRIVISVVLLESIKISTQTLYSPGYIYTSSGTITIGGEADLTFKYFTSGTVITAGSATYQRIPSYKYVGSGRIKLPRIGTSYKSPNIVYVAKFPVKPTRLKGSAIIRPAYYHIATITVSAITVSGSSEYSYSVILSYILSGAATTGGTAITEFLVEKFYTSSGQANIDGSSLYSYIPIYELESTISVETIGIADTIGWRDFYYTALGGIDTYGISETDMRHVLVVVREGAVNPEPRRIEDEPLASNNFKYDLTE